MITSSKFFEKAFFTLQPQQDRALPSQLSPWGQQPRNIGLSSNRYLQNKHISKQLMKNRSTQNRGYQISRQSSKKYIQKKLQHNSDYIYNQPRQQHSKLSTLQEKLKHISQTAQRKILPIIEKQAKLRKKKSQLFPELNMSQFNQLKAKGQSINSYTTIDDALMKRKNRKKLVEEFTYSKSKKLSPNKMPINSQLPKVNKSLQMKPKISGRYVFALGQNPECNLGITGRPTRTFQF